MMNKSGIVLRDFVKNLTEEELEELLSAVVNRKLEMEREEKEAPSRYYTFSGEWYFGCWAKSKEEAERYMEEAPIEEFELNFERVEVEVNDQ